MRKFWAIACTLAFSAFWVFGGLSALAWLDGHPLLPVLAALSALGLVAGIWTRFRLVAATRDFARGQRVAQAETAQI